MLRIIRALSNSSRTFKQNSHDFLKYVDINTSEIIMNHKIYTVIEMVDPNLYETPLSIYFNNLDGVLYLNYYDRKNCTRKDISFLDKLENYTDEELILSYGRDILDNNLIDFEYFEESDCLVLDKLIEFIKG